MLEASTPFWVFQDTSKASTCPESPALEMSKLGPNWSQGDQSFYFVWTLSRRECPDPSFKYSWFIKLRFLLLSNLKLVAYFEKKVYFKVKIDICLTFKLIDFLVLMLQYRENSIKVFFFAYENMTKTPSKVEH